jgi:hypothetical protein
MQISHSNMTNPRYKNYLIIVVKLIVLNQMNITLSLTVIRNMQISHSNTINPRYKNYSIIFISKRMVFKTQTSVKM